MFSDALPHQTCNPDGFWWFEFRTRILMIWHQKTVRQIIKILWNPLTSDRRRWHVFWQFFLLGYWRFFSLVFIEIPLDRSFIVWLSRIFDFFEFFLPNIDFLSKINEKSMISYKSSIFYWFSIKNQYLEKKNRKIENPRQSNYKAPIKGDFYKNQTKKSSIA